MEGSEKKKKVVVHTNAIKLLTETTWKFAHTILWQQFPFTKEEVKLAKLYIQDFYQRIPAKGV